jgi:hypothetical protein
MSTKITSFVYGNKAITSKVGDLVCLDSQGLFSPSNPASREERVVGTIVDIHRMSNPQMGITTKIITEITDPVTVQLITEGKVKDFSIGAVTKKNRFELIMEER